MMQPISERDLNHVLDHTRDLWEELRGERIFITGGTGFFGCWLLESFLFANAQLNLGAKATILSRSPQAFLNRMTHLKGRNELQWIQGDVTNFTFPDGNFPFIIHAATEASAKLTSENPRKMFDTIVDGTRRIIEFGQTHGARKFLLTSSGAVYGRQPPDLNGIPEDYLGGPNPLDPLAVYGEGKRAAEMLCAVSSNNSPCEIKIARCFAFVGPHLPLDAHFAIGNFIRDAIKGGPIIIQGDGTSLRSYLYASDLAIWLWTILFKGKHLRPYNVGSEKIISILQLAELISHISSQKTTIQVCRDPFPNVLPERYVPLVERAKEELKLVEYIDLRTAINFSNNWFEHNC